MKQQQPKMAADNGLEEIDESSRGPLGATGASSVGGPHQGSDGGVIDHSYFQIGMIIEVVTIHQSTLRGEVLAYDAPSRMLAIKCPASNGKAGASDVQFVNLAFTSSVVCISDPSDQPLPPLPNLNFIKLGNRMKTSVEEKRRKMGYIGVNVSPLAQKLINTITKTISEVRWNGDSIVVLDHVTISPPYDVSSCSSSDLQALQHVQKLVGKFHKENGDTTSQGSSGT